MRFFSKNSMRMFGIAILSGALGAGIGGAAMAYQGHMWNALGDLRAAHNELELALSNKGGHRNNAIELINQAIDEVQAGIDEGSEH